MANSGYAAEIERMVENRVVATVPLSTIEGLPAKQLFHISMIQTIFRNLEEATNIVCDLIVPSARKETTLPCRTKKNSPSL